MIISFGTLTIEASCTPDFLTMNHFTILIDDVIKYDISNHSLTWTWRKRGYKSYLVTCKVQFIDYTIEEHLFVG